MDDCTFDRLTRILSEQGSRRDAIGPIAGFPAALASPPWIETAPKRKRSRRKEGQGNRGQGRRWRRSQMESRLAHVSAAAQGMGARAG